MLVDALTRRISIAASKIAMAAQLELGEVFSCYKWRSIPEGPEMFVGSDVKFVVGNGRGRQDALTQFVARQDIQCIACSKNYDRAGQAGGVDFPVRLDGGGAVLTENSQSLPVEDDLARRRFVACHHTSIAHKVEPVSIEKRRRDF